MLHRTVNTSTNAVLTFASRQIRNKCSQYLISVTRFTKRLYYNNTVSSPKRIPNLADAAFLNS